MNPKPIILTDTPANTYTGPDPQPMVVVGSVNAALTPAAFVAVSASPADVAALASQVIALRTSLVNAGLMAAS